jgi:hypothetical protein
MTLGLSKPDKTDNLTMHCFITICDLIENSSHDKQDKLNEILAHYVDQLNSTMLPESLNKTTLEVINDIQCYFCNIFRSCFRKKVNMIDLNLAEKVYFSIESTFKFRNGVYEEGLLAIAALIDSKIYIFINKIFFNLIFRY